MLQFQNLTLIHQKDQFRLVDGLTGVVHPGDKVAIIGEEGTGKSSLLKWLCRCPEVNDYLEAQGSYQCIFQQIGYLPQFLPNKEEPLSVYDFLFHNLDANKIDYSYLAKLASDFQLDQDFLYSNQEMGTLSGGQKIKIQLMKILLYHPDILLLDEPSNDLDYESIQWLENFIRTSDLAILYISHDVVLLKNTATSILHLEKIAHQQRAVVHFVKEDYQTYIEQRKSAADKQLQIALKQRSEDKKRNAQLQQVKQKVQHQLRTTKLDTKGRLLAKKMANLKSREKRFEKERAQFAEMPQQEEAIGLKWQTVQAVPSSKPLIHLENDQLKIADKILVEPLDFTFFGQEKVGIVGNNGIGKSLFLHKIAEMLQKRTDIQMKYMPQNYFEELDTTQSPVEYLLSHTKQDQATVMTYLGSLQFFVQEMQRPIAYLSGGQRAKLVILGLLLSQANVLLLDEPTRNLSPTSNQVLTQQLQQYNGTLLTVSHDRYFLEQVCEKIYQLDKTGLQRIF